MNDGGCAGALECICVRRGGFVRREEPESMPRMDVRPGGTDQYGGILLLGGGKADLAQKSATGVLADRDRGDCAVGTRPHVG